MHELPPVARKLWNIHAPGVLQLLGAGPPAVGAGQCELMLGAAGLPPRGPVRLSGDADGTRCREAWISRIRLAALPGASPVFWEQDRHGEYLAVGETLGGLWGAA